MPPIQTPPGTPPSAFGIADAIQSSPQVPGGLASDVLGGVQAFGAQRAVQTEQEREEAFRQAMLGLQQQQLGEQRREFDVGVKEGRISRGEEASLRRELASLDRKARAAETAGDRVFQERIENMRAELARELQRSNPAASNAEAEQLANIAASGLESLSPEALVPRLMEELGITRRAALLAVSGGQIIRRTLAQREPQGPFGEQGTFNLEGGSVFGGTPQEQGPDVQRAFQFLDENEQRQVRAAVRERGRAILRRIGRPPTIEEEQDMLAEEMQKFLTPEEERRSHPTTGVRAANPRLNTVPLPPGGIREQ